MKDHIARMRYTFRHKWYVFLECCELDIPWRGIVHDWHKFLPSEWLPYVRFFHNPDGTEKQRYDKTGYYKPEDTGAADFDVAWFLHQKRSFHHWQSWCLPTTSGEIKALPMLDTYRREMLADWRGAARARNKPIESVLEWYKANGDKMHLHPETRQWIKIQLGLYDEQTEKQSALEEEFEVLRRLEQCDYLCGGTSEIDALVNKGLASRTDPRKTEHGQLTNQGMVKLLQYRAEAASKDGEGM